MSANDTPAAPDMEPEDALGPLDLAGWAAWFDEHYGDVSEQESEARQEADYFADHRAEQQAEWQREDRT